MTNRTGLTNLQQVEDLLIKKQGHRKVSFIYKNEGDYRIRELAEKYGFEYSVTSFFNKSTDTRISLEKKG
jgi:hypothetical protein